MPLAKLNLAAPQEGYSVDDGEAVRRAKMSAGLSRIRLDHLDAAQEVDVTLVMSDSEFNYWRSFHRAILVRGSLPFLLDLMIDDSDVSEYTVQIIPGTMQETVRGHAHFVQLRLEVEASEANMEYDETLVMLYDLYGEEAGELLAALEQLVNFEFHHIV